MVGTADSALIREVSFIQSVLNREVSLFRYWSGVKSKHVAVGTITDKCRHNKHITVTQNTITHLSLPNCALIMNYSCVQARRKHELPPDLHERHDRSTAYRLVRDLG